MTWAPDWHEHEPPVQLSDAASDKTRSAAGERSLRAWATALAGFTLDIVRAVVRRCGGAAVRRRKEGAAQKFNQGRSRNEPGHGE